MWLMNEDGDELTIRGIPLVIWSIAFSFLGLGIYLLLPYLTDSSRISEILKESALNILTISFALLFMPIGSLVMLYFFPLITTKVNRREKSVRIEKLGILGKRINRYGFDALDGGFRVKSEEDEDNRESLKLYFNLKSGQRIFLSSDITELWKGKAYDVAMKANEFLRK
ncbi:MAG: hypothetical protein K1X72_02120 [Pyrinomonadaceae bacterium]|nr:hypothetical protein [Pyrinomonadaceae bacterium]